MAKFHFDVTVRVVAEEVPGTKSAKHLQTDFFLEVSDNLDEDKYMDAENVLSADGAKAVTETLIHGLIGVIHFAEHQGYRKSPEHLRDIISKLEKGFAAVAVQGKATFGS